ncbi:hypothetical protein TTHERM_00086880 (macronuclear) [Tetrahymena thermophila SB210]|uniref:Uncharacterized protein n=1 Tax=Tetrahymena thermophila (strain SB210) TaxID=312017 RepID=Q236K9_TETTS|nr:hypothetical protein TTHERM_00086880 [Tetrahymena thermophila SB210]EAR92491.2 hypothetical protein TTHERM_00086880 [Tetrahymena thermophila SB210]|eukprot:XP_001012736.2 hypothetical protein TTHERM_00086880 [Tetrahymena thermophila SB210]
MDFNDIAELNRRPTHNKIQQNIQNKFQSFLLNQSQAKEKKIIQVEGHTFLKKSQSKENLDKIQALTNRKKVGNIYEDIEDIIDRAISDDEEQIDILDNLNQSLDEEKYIEEERIQMKKKLYLAEQEIQQKKLEQERFEKLKKEFKDKQLELKCFCKKIGTKIVFQCEFCKELKKIKLIN